MRYLFAALAGFLGLLILIFFFSNLNSQTSSVFAIISNTTNTRSGIVLMFGVIIGFLQALFLMLYHYYDVIFGEKGPEWSDSGNVSSVVNTDKVDEWQNDEWK